jgi:uncharacterized protein (TIGR03084 family)
LAPRDAGEMHDICRDLADEHAALDAVVADIPPAAWTEPTPAPGWAVRDQISHLYYFDLTAAQAVTDPEAFSRGVEALLAASSDPSVEPGRTLSPADLLERWRSGRADLLAVLEPLDPKQRIPWYGPAMSARSFATARLMETWAHGQDVVDALGADRPATDRLRHVAHIGVGARPFSYRTRGLEPPSSSVRVELEPPSGGEPWTWGEPDVPDQVRGPALDFCLVVTQRRHRDDTSLVVEGAAAAEWMSIAQAFAGPPGAGRQAGQFRADRSA